MSSGELALRVQQVVQLGRFPGSGPGELCGVRYRARAVSIHWSGLHAYLA
ncbi:MAG TPA: hypothetical protein VFN61_08740 [Acidimicrobiales bacterium]|nr:hypothetical protein [Acidimicrobiales bacterium]